VLVGIDGLRLRRPILPGALVGLEADAVDRGRLWRFAVRATLDGEVAAEGTLLAALAP
jgi:3-hydroxymyristoyl/3-hydroxydecanoyl-(acyl carrier protein) dehydratase